VVKYLVTGKSIIIKLPGVPSKLQMTGKWSRERELESQEEKVITAVSRVDLRAIMAVSLV